MSVRLLCASMLLLLVAACSGEPRATPTAAEQPAASAPADAPEVLPPPDFDDATTPDDPVVDEGEGAVADEPVDEPIDAADDTPPANTIAVGEPNPGAPGVVDMSCRTDADCAIKDVGSCCGYRPACVNEASPTFPDRVKANCAREGRVGICGFPAITGCKCTAGKCEGTGSEVGERVH